MDSLLIVSEVAAILRVKPTTVYALVARNALPHVRIAQGRKRALIRFRRTDVEAFLEYRSVSPGVGNSQRDSAHREDTD